MTEPDIAAISPFVEAAIALADAVLDRPFADPDDDAAMAARALLRIDPTSTLALLADTPSVEPPGMDVERLAEGDDDTPSYGDLRDTIWNIIRAVGRSADGRRYEARTVEFDSVINEALGLVACAPVGAPTRWLAAQAAFRIAAGLPEFTEEAAREHRAALHAAEIVDPRDDTWTQASDPTQASDSPEKP